MSARLKALRTLLKVRERQAASLQQAHDTARRELDAHREQLALAIDQEHAERAAEVRGHAALDALTRGAFTPHALRALDFRIEELKAAAQRALCQTRDGEASVARALARVDEAAAVMRLNDRRIERFREQLATLVREREEALEEQAEEETQETSTARYAARLRATAEEAANG